jgi:hypothetical protein
MGKYHTNNILVFVTVAFAIGFLNTVPIFAQEGNETMSNATTTEEFPARDTVTVLLQDLLLPVKILSISMIVLLIQY